MAGRHGRVGRENHATTFMAGTPLPAAGSDDGERRRPGDPGGGAGPQRPRLSGGVQALRQGREGGPEEPRRLVREGGGGPRPPADGGGGHPRVLQEGGRARARAPAVPGGPRELLDGPRTVQRSGAVLQQGRRRGPGERGVLLVRVRGELPGEGARRDGEVPRRQDEGHDRAEGALVRAEGDRPVEGRREAPPPVIRLPSIPEQRPGSDGPLIASFEVPRPSTR